VGRLVTGWDKYARSTVSAALHYRL
jgi:hypothetical protein